MKNSFLIADEEHIDPKSDHRWMPDGKNIWFLPCVLDLKNKSYCGYWYATKTFTEDLHLHTGTAEGFIFRGVFLLMYANQKISVKKNQGFWLPPGTVHTAKLIPGKNGFLYFGTVIGKAKYKRETIDAASYLKEAKKHYKKHGISLERIFTNQ